MCKEKGGAAGVSWLRTFQFNPTSIRKISLCRHGRSSCASRCRCLKRSDPARAALQRFTCLGAMTGRSLTSDVIAQQEELDWEVYRLYDLVDEDLTYPGDDLPELALGERAFEIVLARKDEGGRGRHGVVRAPRVDPDHRDPVALAGGLPAAGRAADRADRVPPVSPAAGEAGAQAALGQRVVGEAGGACAAGLAARPA